MKLYVKQKMFSIGDKFTIKDEFGNDKYFAEGKIFSVGHKVRIYDMNNNEVIYIKQKLMSFLPKYEIYVNGNLAGVLTKKITFLRPKYIIEDSNLELEGDIWEYDYTLKNGDHEIMNVSKKVLSFSDCYEINIHSDEDELLSLAVTLAVDCQLETEDNNN